MRSALPWVTAALVVVLDRVTKMLVVDHLTVGSWTPVVPGLALTRVHNTGIAFSLFSDGSWLSRVLLHAVILTAVVLIAWMARRHGHHRLLAGFAFGLILGGAAGNLIDRVLYGWVIDFLHLWLRLGDRTWSWPDFNVADAAITVGAILLILNELLAGRGQPSHAPDPS
ncbi:MAG TPA: signal peptidase II [Thermoanaerobaculales bacterium]|nr:signal peptidase II [Thermoanaerobaculales bacterium]HPA79309.1 signal peptidase II [Thermoanaerobaculales bacterium]HQL31279.1 signal peptidase II [Thermoanaerobaculales bacterium]HQN96148.1 signal peptidase II [Thermoanaerobaculales bacterium]HQP42650.1 signal peptidase II [Thermoanaerobaculales bacterium]